MNGSILEFSKGKVIKGEAVLGVYFLTNGMILFSETAQDTEDGSMSFDPEGTVILQAGQARSGQVQLAATKASESMFKPWGLVVPKTAITMIITTGDHDFVARMRATLAGLVMPGAMPGGAMN